MTPDQQFVIAILSMAAPVVMSIVTIVGGWVLFKQQNVKLDAATDASKKAEAAANHGKEVVSVMQENFKAVVKIIAPEAAAAVANTPPAPSNTPPETALESTPTKAAIQVEVVNPSPVPVVETKSATAAEDAGK